MKIQASAPWRAGLLAVLVGLSGGAALAEKPEWAGRGGKGGGQQGEYREQERHERGYNSPGASIDIRIGGYFNDGQRAGAHDYYGQQFRAGNCPPGLAKKHNGCLPPGQAKKWQMGRPLPSDVAYYPVPPEVSVRLGVPPAGYKYVRVAKDILLIAVGSSMVVDAIEDLGR
jgi:Ni/Co efflux regulator RcnB